MAKRGSRKRHYQGARGEEFTKELKTLDLTRVMIVPIDAAKNTHKALTANYFGEIFDPPFEFKSNRTGVNELMAVIEATSAKIKSQKIIVAVRAHRAIPRAGCTGLV